MKKSGLIFIALIMAIQGWAQVQEQILIVSAADGEQIAPQVCYNTVNMEYMAVWEDLRNSGTSEPDIWGQIINGDGSMKGENFIICNNSGRQGTPHLDYDPVNNRYLVIFVDFTYDSEGDIYGVFIDENGVKIPVARSFSDSTFVIDNVQGGVYGGAVSYNFSDGRYLVIWDDYRNDVMWGLSDVYGQIISADGTFLAMPGPGIPKTSGNFGSPVSADPTANEANCDLSFCEQTREWFVVFGDGEYENCKVQGVRVDRNGYSVKPDGVQGFEKMEICAYTYWCPGSTRPRVQFNTEAPLPASKSTAGRDLAECEVVWQQAYMSSSDDMNIYGQRIAFITHAQAYTMGWNPSTQSDTSFYAAYADSLGKLNPAEQSNHIVSNAPLTQSYSEIAYGSQDNEYLIVWQDQRNTGQWSLADLYCQQLFVNPDSDMVWLASDRINTTFRDINTVLDSSDQYKAGMCGIAHNRNVNEFLTVYCYEVPSGVKDLHARIMKASEATGIKSDKIERPLDFIVQANYPNPFNPSTHIEYQIPTSGLIYGEVLDVRGRRVKILSNAIKTAGIGRLIWDGTDQHGNYVASGIYFYSIRYGKQNITKKMLLLR
ncbi:T9SS type A sorting domain-containing protein [bacterium]|nr:T9SS type A sorting domain-containing protein [bacterium]